MKFQKTNNRQRLLIAGLRGGSGKTTLSLGIIRACRDKGLKVMPFKKGPDYIDAGWLAYASGSPCYNLDPFLIGKDKVLSSFVMHSAAQGADISIIEGNRGLFDGTDEEGAFSTAEVAKTLKAPVILVVDCTKITRTVAAILLGIQSFDKRLKIKAVVLNQIAGSRHESVIRRSIEKYCSIPVLGAIPRLDKELFPERHMGLTPYQEHPQVEQAIKAAAEIVNRHADVEGLLKISGQAGKIQASKFRIQDLIPCPSAVRIGVIKDSAFQFYYPENIEELQRHGAEITELSALGDKKLPDIDALYIGGGFPETHAPALAKNTAFRKSLKDAIKKGLPVYAECGGLMYLGEGIILNDKKYPMTGIFPISFLIEKRPQAHGYTIAEVTGRNPFFSEGITLRGHEFHYSGPVNAAGDMDRLSYAFKMKRGKGLYKNMDGICYKNVLATYMHLHAYGTDEWAAGMVRSAEKYKGR